MSPRAAAALERLLAKRVPVRFLEQLAEHLEASSPAGATTRVVFHQGRGGRLVDIRISAEKQVPLTEQDVQAHTPR